MGGAAVTRGLALPGLEPVRLTDHLHLDVLPRVPDDGDGLLHRPRCHVVYGDHLVPLRPPGPGGHNDIRRGQVISPGMGALYNKVICFFKNIKYLS